MTYRFYCRFESYNKISSIRIIFFCFVKARYHKWYPKIIDAKKFNYKDEKYISKNRMRITFLLIKRFSGGVVGEPGFPTN